VIALSFAQAYRGLFGPDAVIEIVALLEQRQPRIALHEVMRTAEHRAWSVQLMIEVAGAIAAGAFPPNPSWACTACERTVPGGGSS
jgi:hypothetical protein